MAYLEQYVDDCLAHGRSYFSGKAARKALGIAPSNFAAAATRLVKKGRLAIPRHGFFLILRPEDKVSGAPDPVRWIDPLMKYQRLDYRISLLRAAAFHGSSHQAAMVFQVVVSKQLRDFELGRHRLQFLYQAPAAFSCVNRSDALDKIKSDEGFAKMAGLELTLLDCVRYFQKAGGMSAVAQIAKDIGGRVAAGKLAKLAASYENSSVRRLGFLLELAGHEVQARALEAFVKKAKTIVPLNPSIKPLVVSLDTASERNVRWKLLLNEHIEIDS